MATVQSVLEDALSLEPIEREILLVHLAAALRGEPMPGESVDWEAEVTARVAGLASGREAVLSDSDFEALIDRAR